METSLDDIRVFPVRSRGQRRHPQRIPASTHNVAAEVRAKSF